jgi:hypothetical protein
MICEQCGYTVDIAITKDLRAIADGVEALHAAVCPARLLPRIVSGSQPVEVWRE